MRTSPPVGAGWRVVCVLLAFIIAITPLALLVAPDTAHAAEPHNPQYTIESADASTVDDTTPAITASADKATRMANSPAKGIGSGTAAGDWQIVASQTTTATTTVTATRGGGLSLPRLSLPRTNNDAENEQAEAADEDLTEDDTTGEGTDSESADSDTAGEAAETAESAQADDADPAAGSAVDNLADVRKAVVQIEAVGTFVDPAEGLQLNAAGRGSGFIIDPSGIAVTNNHVVTGGGLYKVYVDGEDQPRNAKVLGVSECADLAVIDIQGDDFAYLEWYDGRIQVGLDVYAVGFPLGDPEYTMTRGIVAKERADGETNWASVDRVIQHDASINPGNSGGPLVNADGQVLAVNYAGNSQTNQYFAIERDQAIEVIEQLRTGVNVDSIGINGEAVNNGEGLSGHWVASVKSGSPADLAGIQGGDIILKMEGLVLADDGTMSTYCDILRSHSADDVLAVQVLRFATEEVLEGQLNGRELTPSFSIAEELTGENAGTTGTTTDGSTAAAPTYSEYTSITDRTGILSVEVPTEWSDVESTDWVQDEETVGIRLVAATSLEDLYASWGFPGLIFGFSRALVADYTPADLLDTLQYNNDCTYDGRSEVPEGVFTGAYDIWKECKGENNGAVIMSLVPEDNDYILLLEIYLAGDVDFDALDRILDTFVVDRNNIPSTASTGSVTGNTGSSGSAGENIFDLVDVNGLIYEYTLLNDQALTAIIPSEWGDVSSDLWVDEDDEQLGYRVSAASDIDAYNDTWTTSGIYVRSATGLESALDIDDLLDSVDLTNTCTYDDRYTHSHTIYGITYEGAYDLYTDCDGESNAFAYLAVQSTDLDQAVLLEFLAVDEADVEAFDVLLQSFYIGEVVESSEGNGAVDEAVEYVTISDETETLLVRVPPDWTDIRSGDWEVDGSVVGIQLEAAPDLDGYENSWTTPGLFFGASPEFSGSEPSEILDVIDFSSDCSASDRFEYDDGFFAGHYDLWEACGDTETNIVFLAATSLENPSYLVLLGVQLPTADDFATLDEIFSSFNLDLPADGISTDSTNTDVVPTVTVRVDALNVRNGPGTGYNRVGSVRQGDELLVIGEVYDCGWLQVQTRNELVGWISGSLEYIDYNVDCAAIPLLEVPAPPASSGNNSRSSGTGGTVNNEGCMTIQNGVGPELTATFTRRGDGWNITYKVPPDGEYRQCFPPGEYTYTIDAPPPWESINGTITISAGDDSTFPIYPEE